MADVDDWNAQVIAEFRANEGRVGGQFEGAPVVLMDRCRNMTSAGRATVEVGAEYETSTAGIRTIRVLALTRAS